MAGNNEMNVNESSDNEAANLLFTDKSIAIHPSQPTEQQAMNQSFLSSDATEKQINFEEYKLSLFEWLLSLISLPLGIVGAILNFVLDENEVESIDEFNGFQYVTTMCILTGMCLSTVIFIWLTLDFYVDSDCLGCGVVFVQSTLSLCIKTVRDETDERALSKFDDDSYFKAMVSRRIFLVLLIDIFEVVICSAVQQHTIGFIYLGYGIFECWLFALDCYRMRDRIDCALRLRNARQAREARKARQKRLKLHQLMRINS
eukprot:75745_1